MSKSSHDSAGTVCPPGKESAAMRMCVILNPRAGSAEQAAMLQEMLTEHADVTLCKTTRRGQATALAAEALQQGAELIVAAGGDGTVNEVLNGLAPDFARATFGVLPLGTGNDLARTLAMPTAPVEAWRVLTSGSVRCLDLMQVRTAGRTAYGLNMAVGGFTGQMNEVLTDEMKASWGPLAYLVGAVQVLPDLTDYKTTIAYDNNPIERITALNIAVANGRTAGGGLPVVPQANPEDGHLDLVLVRYGPLLSLAEVAARFLAGTYLDSEYVVHRRVHRVQIAARPGMWFNLDGELLTKDPITVTVQPQALRVVVGPDYLADPQTP
jgi:diacylglycerol kinase (ATP)